MADQTITESQQPGGRVRYELGRANWGSPIPDIRRPGSTVQIADNQLIDVIILGDGFTSPAAFRGQLVRWLQAFYTLPVYELFAGAFRIRALFTPSTEPASSDRDSYYRCRLTDDESGVSKEDHWWAKDDADGRTFRQRLWEAVDSFADVNRRRYSADLDLGDDIVVSNKHVRDTYRNLVVSMFVRTGADSPNVSGRAAGVPRELGHALNGRVAFGANSTHEFSHALGFLSDEYIDGANLTNDRVNPDKPSVFTLSNLSCSDRDDSVPWLHLAPTGRFRRTAGGIEPPPVVGWLWVGAWSTPESGTRSTAA